MTQHGSIPQVIQVIAQPEFVLEITFDTGNKGYLPLRKHLPLTGYFAPLAQREFFERVFVDHGTLCWPNHIDLDPVIVHAWAMGEPIELAEAVLV